MGGSGNCGGWTGGVVIFNKVLVGESTVGNRKILHSLFKFKLSRLMVSLYKLIN